MVWLERLSQCQVLRNNSVFQLRYHLVLVTKYRRPVLNEEMRDRLREIFSNLLDTWRCELIEFGGEEDHIHLLIEAHPAMDLSRMINNLKTVSSRRIRKQFPEQVAKYYWKPVFWHSAYFIGSVGGATLDTVRKYVESQGEKL